MSHTDSRFDPFHIISTPYKVVDGHSITLDVVFPKTLRNSGLKKVIVRFHGGYLITGTSLYPEWFSQWILDFAALNDCIIISPNYRLLPESCGIDILQDIEEFWKKLDGGLVHDLIRHNGYSGIRLDMKKLLLVGESAGGFLAVQSAMSHPGKFCSLVLAYPMLDLRSPWFTESFEKPIVGISNLPSKMIDEYISNSPRTPVSEGDSLQRTHLSFAIVQNGRYMDYLGADSRLFVMDRLGEDGCRELPPIFIYHGREDSAVPPEGSIKFVRTLKALHPQVKVHLSIQPGDHGFHDSPRLGDAEWFQEGLNAVTRSWLSSRGNI